MLSRSSSAYQPLERACSIEAIAARADDDEDDGRATEMTSIAVISNHPFRASTATTTTVVAGGGRGNNNGALGMGQQGHHHQDLDFAALCAEEKTQWTNFHFVMCLGIGGFFVFWILLLSRMYLPPRLQFWRSDFDFGAIFGVDGGGSGSENVTNVASSDFVTESSAGEGLTSSTGV